MTGCPSPTGPAPLARPTLLPGLRRIWRDRHRLQLGVDPARAVVLELPDAGAARLLDLLDGTRSERTVIAHAGRYGIGAADARAMLAALRAAGLVLGAQSLLPHQLPDQVRRRLAGEAAALALRGRAPGAGGDPGNGSDQPATAAQILRRRASARVVVTGHGRLAGPVALALAQSGVGHVWPALGPLPGPAAAGAAAAGPAGPGPDRRPGPRLAATISRAAPGTRTGPLRRSEASFVVQVGATGPANLAAAGFARRRLAHLAVAVRDGTPVIGPLVPPTGGPCLNCVDLHRRDRDPEWPELAAQLAQPADDPCAAATLLSAAGLAAGEVLCWLDGGTPATLGASIELTGPGRLRRRSWPPHPHCSCLRRRPPRPGRA
jgi:bacteriocin biosynthesis cyclodehydratase domain-containing protein